MSTTPLPDWAYFEAPSLFLDNTLARATRVGCTLDCATGDLLPKLALGPDGAIAVVAASGLLDGLFEELGEPLAVLGALDSPNLDELISYHRLDTGFLGVIKCRIFPVRINRTAA